MFGNPTMRGRLTQEYEARQRAAVDRRNKARVSNPSSLGLTPNSSRESYNIISNVTKGSSSHSPPQVSVPQRATSNHTRYDFDILTHRDRGSDPNAPIDPRVRRGERPAGRENPVISTRRGRMQAGQGSAHAGSVGPDLLAYTPRTPRQAAEDAARAQAAANSARSQHHKSSSDGYAHSIISMSADTQHVDKSTYLYGSGGSLRPLAKKRSGSSGGGPTERNRVDHLEELYHNREPLYPDKPRGRRYLEPGHAASDDVRSSLVDPGTQAAASRAHTRGGWDTQDRMVTASGKSVAKRGSSERTKEKVSRDHLWYNRPDPEPPERAHLKMAENPPNKDSVRDNLGWLNPVERRAYESQVARDKQAGIGPETPRRRGRQLVVEPDHVFSVLNGESEPRGPHPPSQPRSFDDLSSPRRPRRTQHAARDYDDIPDVLRDPQPFVNPSFESRYSRFREQEVRDGAQRRAMGKSEYQRQKRSVKW